MKYKHYAPKGDLTIYEGEAMNVIKAVCEAAGAKLEQGYKVGIMTSEEYEGIYKVSLGQYAKRSDAQNNLRTDMKWERDSYGRFVQVPVTEAKNYSDYAGNLSIEVVGSREDEDSVARNLFDTLRKFDTDGTAFIFGECFTDSNLGAAIMNRLVKAAGYNIEKV